MDNDDDFEVLLEILKVLQRIEMWLAKLNRTADTLQSTVSMINFR